MAQWSSATYLNRWLGNLSGRRPPCPASPSVSLRWPRKKGQRSPMSVSGEQQTTQAEVAMEEEGAACQRCDGRGWLLCDFCKGKKNNVRSEGSRIYRRCPSCKAAGYVVCSRCRVYKCITFPDSNDGEL